MLMLLNSIRLIHKARPVELLRSDSAGEREPKAKWALALLGVILLGAGYYIAVTVKNPVLRSRRARHRGHIPAVHRRQYRAAEAAAKKQELLLQNKALYQYLVDALQDETKRGRPCEHLHPFHYGARNGFRNYVHVPRIE